MVNILESKNIKDIESCLGIVQYYGKFDQI